MFSKLLIANRGEIVNRIIRTCDRLGIKTVVVYSEADKDAGYIHTATESYFIGASAPVKSYLNSDALIEAVKKSGADAIHPGYGFLSESASFARLVSGTNAKWIGPNPSVMENIESKCYCRVAADRVGVPVTPGSIGAIDSVDEIYAAAEKVGLPILLKLDKGGGGKGIERIDSLASPSDTQAIFDGIRSVGKMAFASEDVYIEKEIIGPRHIEVQFVADNFGNIVCIGERECSIQRRYQKIIEESPSAAVADSERKLLYEYTRKFVKEIHYSGVGTIEYLRSADGTYYLMEINARLQVEHPVSEMVTGIDLVEWQLRIADNEKLSFSQDDIRINGHAIECRIYAEDPTTFHPAPGTITALAFPDTADGSVRLEHALQVGSKISPFYDPMICKLIAWGADRGQCISNVANALSQFRIEGVSTNITTDINIMRNDNFIAGVFDTDFLSKEIINSAANDR
jgi:acetyl/propionyl-CoA carboxylase alpha subunit